MKNYSIVKLKEIIINKFNLEIKIDEFDVRRPFIEYGIGLDSVTNLEFILEIEKSFGIDIDESEINSEILYNFSTLINYLDKIIANLK